MIALLEDPERGGSPSVEAAILAVVFGLLIAFAIAGRGFKECTEGGRASAKIGSEGARES